MADENVSTFPIIDVFKDDMFIWILDPNSTPQSKRYLLSKFIQEMRISYAIDTGVANAYAIALNSILTSYVEGQSFSFKAVNANTGASTVNIDGLGIKSIKRRDGTDLKSGDILAGSINIIQFDGTNFQLLVSSGDGNGHNIENESTPLTDRAALNFEGFEINDDAGNDATRVTNEQLLEGAVNKDAAVNYIFQGEGKVTIDGTQNDAFNFFSDGTTGISAVTFSVRTDAATIFETITFANLVLFLAGTHTTPGESYSVGTATNWEVRFEASFGVSAASKDFGILMNLIRTPNI